MELSTAEEPERNQQPGNVLSCVLTLYDRRDRSSFTKLGDHHRGLYWMAGMQRQQCAVRQEPIAWCTTGNIVPESSMFSSRDCNTRHEVSNTGAMRSQTPRLVTMHAQLEACHAAGHHALD